jgi:hypothetical protein
MGIFVVAVTTAVDVEGTLVVSIWSALLSALPA